MYRQEAVVFYMHLEPNNFQNPAAEFLYVNLLVSLSVSPWMKIQSVYRCRPLKHTIHIFYIFLYFYLYPILDILKRRRAPNIHVQKLDVISSLIFEVSGTEVIYFTAFAKV